MDVPAGLAVTQSIRCFKPYCVETLQITAPTIARAEDKGMSRGMARDIGPQKRQRPWSD